MSTANDPPTPPTSPALQGPGGPQEPPTIDTDAPWPDEPGQPWPTFPGYQVLSLLGRGGLAVVYRVRHLASGRLEALKVLRNGVPIEHGSGCPFLVHEARLLARLRHPNIITLYGTGEHQGEPYLTMELAEGGDLQQRLHDGPLEARLAARLMEAIARAVHYVNSEGVIYRNLKPANILLTRDGEPRLADFELALPLADEKVERDIGTVCGTPAYMAPEQVRRDRLSPATDVYGLGATLYTLLVGHPPYTGLSTAETLQQVLSEGPTPPLDVDRAVPADLEAVVVRCLMKGPAMRYPTAGAVADDLRRFQAGQPVEPRPLGAVGRAWRWLTAPNG